MRKTLLLCKAGTQFSESVLSEMFRLPAARLYKNWAEVEKRLRELGVPLEKIENIKSDFESGEDTVLVRVP